MAERDEYSQTKQGGAERLLRVLRDAAEDFGAKETLAGLGDRARSLVEDAVRGASAAAAASPTASRGHAADSSAPAGAEPAQGLDRRLEELRACVDEVADLLDAGLERLETLEMQLGDPDAGVERLLAEGIERCERVLGGVEHRILGIEGKPQTTGILHHETPTRAGDVATVLVVAASSTRRAELCLALERQRLRAIAAPDVALALRCTERFAPDAALIDAAGLDEFLDEWADLSARGLLPVAAVLLEAGHSRQLRDELAARGLAWIEDQHGPAATAASLRRLVAVGEAAAAMEQLRHPDGEPIREHGGE